MSVLSRETIHLEECDIEVIETVCCGGVEWYARLPGMRPRSPINNGYEASRLICCDFAEHGSREAAIECAREAISKGLEMVVSED